jgi:hypothetical protein
MSISAQKLALYCDIRFLSQVSIAVGINSRFFRQLNRTHKYELYGKYCELLSVISRGKHSYQCAIKCLSCACHKTAINRLNIHSIFSQCKPRSRWVPLSWDSVQRQRLPVPPLSATFGLLGLPKLLQGLSSAH